MPSTVQKIPADDGGDAADVFLDELEAIVVIGLHFFTPSEACTKYSVVVERGSLKVLGCCMLLVVGAHPSVASRDACITQRKR